MRKSRWIGGVVLGSLLAGCTGSETGSPSSTTESMKAMSGGASSDTPAVVNTIHAFTVNRIDGTPESLAGYEGKVVLIVNVASKCGLTPQYEGLEALYNRKPRADFVVLGFPANDFMGQEPGSNEQIAAFCTREYGVTFPMFEKISVKGADQHPLYRMLSSSSEDPSWNFTKYLVGRDGRLVRRFGPRTSPRDPELVAEIDRLLGSG